MSAIAKSKKKYTPKSSKRAMLVRELAARFQVTEKTVYNAINGDHDSDLAQQIKKEYNRLMKAIDNALK